jgi:hypothetical protein
MLHRLYKQKPVALILGLMQRPWSSFNQKRGGDHVPRNLHHKLRLTFEGDGVRGKSKIFTSINRQQVINISVELSRGCQEMK